MGFRTVFFSGTGLLLATVASAQTQYPEGPIRVVVPFAAGGGVDALARPFAVYLSEALGQNVLVENQGSATGELGAVNVKMSEPDGYTLILSSAAFGTTPAFYPGAAYDPLQDFQTISILATAPQLVVATNELAVGSIGDIVEMAQESDELTVALSATTGIQALATYLLAERAGIEMTYVPYTGAGAAFPDLVSGRVHLMVDNPGSSGSQVESGSLKLIATTGLERMSSYPDTPTVAETYPDFEALNWFVLAAPAGTPDEIVAMLNEAAQEAINHPEMVERLRREGTSPLRLTRDESTSFLEAEARKWSETVSTLGLEVQ